MSDEIERARRVVGEATAKPWETEEAAYEMLIGQCAVDDDIWYVGQTSGDREVADANAIALMRNTYEPLLEALAALDRIIHCHERDDYVNAVMHGCDIRDAALTALREALPEEGGEHG